MADTTVSTEQVTEPSSNALGLSDEEFMNADPISFIGNEADVVDQDIDSDVDDTTDDDVAPSDKEEGDVSKAREQAAVTDEEEEVGQPAGDTQKEHENSSDDEAIESLDTSDKDSTDTKKDTSETKEPNYESAYKEVTAPFKANGIEMQVKDPKDIIRLMQMGANYQQKMAKLKPNLKVIKMLENNGLLDENKLNNLIDISKKDPKAVAQLLKESGLDPLDIDTGASSDYKPTDYSISDKEHNLDQVLDEIKDTETFSKTINVLTKEWDNGSKSTISDNPEIISIINTHMGNGVFDKVNTVMQQEKALGKLKGITDVDAYKQIAEYLAQTGVLTGGGPQKVSDKSPSKVSSETEDTAKSQADADRDKKRKATAPVKQTASKKDTDESNFLGLSDDDFMKKFVAR